jgi:LytS/YehU family sensor histidine kinase
LQQTRFENKFDFEIIIDGEILNHKKIPSLLLQPLVENAITHGLLNKEEKGHLTIKFKTNKTNDEIICVIDDDGVGREAARIIENEIESKTESFGSDLIKELINIFNTNEDIKIDIQYFDKTIPDTGTTVTITIKELSHE